MGKDELIIIDRMYELTKWFLGHLAKFPRSQRYGLGRQIESRLYSILDGLLRAKYGGKEEKRGELHAASLDLEFLRILVRLADELQLLPHSSYEYAVRELCEIGKMLGGWLRSQKQNEASSTG